MPPKKVLEPEASRTLRQKTYSFVVATAVLASWATVERPLTKNWNWCARADVHYKHLAQAGRKSLTAIIIVVVDSSINYYNWLSAVSIIITGCQQY